MLSRPGIHPRITAYIEYGAEDTYYEGTGANRRLVRHCIGKRMSCYGKLIWTFDVYLRGDQKSVANMIVDYRSIELLRQGCCPDKLEAEMLGAPPSYGEESAGAEEAAALHEKGYIPEI